MAGKGYEELWARIDALEEEVRKTKEVMEAVKSERNLLRTTLLLNPNPIALKDADSVYMAVNPAFCRLLGKAEAELIGKRDADFLPPSQAEIYQRHDGEVIKAGEPRSHVTVTGAGAKERWMKIFKVPVFDERGACVGVFCSITDISRQRKAEEALSQREADFWEVNKELLDTNRALSVLATNIEKNWKEMERRIGLTISSKISPIVKELQKDNSIRNRAELDMLATYVKDLTSGLTDGAVVTTSLSPTELRIAAMVKNGLSSQEIAEQLHVSLHTIKTHRKNIRRKLDIQRSRVNLSSYLKSKME